MRLHSPLSALVFVTGLFGITGCASEPETDARKAGSEASIEERQRIVQFWELHRKATRLRLDARSDEAIAAYEDALRLNDSHEDALTTHANLTGNAARFPGGHLALPGLPPLLRRRAGAVFGAVGFLRDFPVRPPALR